ncbi:hypothetical protein [Azospirillum argentinense]
MGAEDFIGNLFFPAEIPSTLLFSPDFKIIGDHYISTTVNINFTATRKSGGHFDALAVRMKNVLCVLRVILIVHIRSVPSGDNGDGNPPTNAATRCPLFAVE